MSLASQIALAFLTDYPTPTSAAHLGEARMAAFCRRHAYRGGKSPAELLSRLRAAPVAPVGLPPATLAAMVTAQVTVLKTLQTVISEVERLIAVRVVAHPRSNLFENLPGVGMITWHSCSPRSARSSTGRTVPNKPRPSAARRLSPVPPARPAASTSAGPRVPAPARPSPASLTTLECKTTGPPHSTPTPGHEENATRTPPASSPAPGSA